MFFVVGSYDLELDIDPFFFIIITQCMLTYIRLSWLFRRFFGVLSQSQLPKYSFHCQVHCVKEIKTTVSLFHAKSASKIHYNETPVHLTNNILSESIHGTKCCSGQVIKTFEFTWTEFSFIIISDLACFPLKNFWLHVYANKNTVKYQDFLQSFLNPVKKIQKNHLFLE